MFEIYVSTTYDKFEVKHLMSEYLYSKYPHLPPNIIHSIDIPFPTFKTSSYIVTLNIDPEMVPEFYQSLYLEISIYPNLKCQHLNVY
jgi:hypothetical protein